MQATIALLALTALGATASPLEDHLQNADTTEGSHTLVRRDFPPLTGDVCPGAEGLFYKAKTQWTYQITCNRDTSGSVDIATYKGIPNVLACAEKCDEWDTRGLTPKCVAASFLPGQPSNVNNCFLKQANGLVNYPATGVQTAFLGNKAD